MSVEVFDKYIKENKLQKRGQKVFERGTLEERISFCKDYLKENREDNDITPSFSIPTSIPTFKPTHYHNSDFEMYSSAFTIPKTTLEWYSPDVVNNGIQQQATDRLKDLYSKITDNVSLEIERDFFTNDIRFRIQAAIRKIPTNNNFQTVLKSYLATRG